MSVIRFSHVLVLSLLLGLVLLPDSRAEPARSPLALVQLNDTRWRVIEIDGTAYPETRSPIVLRFAAGTIHVDQTCTPFLVVLRKGSAPEIRQLNTGRLCFMQPPEEIRILDIFRNLSHVEAAGKDGIRVVSADGGDLFALRQADTGRQP